MARASKKKESKSEEFNFDFMNEFVVRGVIQRVLYSSDKVNKYSIKVPMETPKGNTAFAFLNLTEFTSDDPFEEGAQVMVSGHLSSGSYEDKKTHEKRYTTDLVADDIQEVVNK